MFPKCNKNTDTATPSQKCEGTLLPIIRPALDTSYYIVANTFCLFWKCSECDRVIKSVPEQNSLKKDRLI